MPSPTRLTTVEADPFTSPFPTLRRTMCQLYRLAGRCGGISAYGAAEWCSYHADAWLEPGLRKLIDTHPHIFTEALGELVARGLFILDEEDCYQIAEMSRKKRQSVQDWATRGAA